MATEVEKSTYKWVKKHDAIKLIFFLGIAAICFSFFLPYGLVFFFAGLLALLFCRDYKKWNNNWHHRYDSYAYNAHRNRNVEIRKIISKYKSTNNIPPQIKIRLDELKNKNRRALEKIEDLRSLESYGEWGMHEYCRVCGSDNFWFKQSVIKSFAHYHKENNEDKFYLEFCDDCGYLEINRG